MPTENRPNRRTIRALLERLRPPTRARRVHALIAVWNYAERHARPEVNAMLRFAEGDEGLALVEARFDTVLLPLVDDEATQPDDSFPAAFMNHDDDDAIDQPKIGNAAWLGALALRLFAELATADTPSTEDDDDAETARKSLGPDEIAWLVDGIERLTSSWDDLLTEEQLAWARGRMFDRALQELRAAAERSR